MKGDVHIHRDETALFRACAERVAMMAAECVEERGAFHIALAGGSTPEGVYRLLAQSPLKGIIDWSRVHVWFGDERCVPPDHPQSNYRMARAALLTQVPLPEAQVHRIVGEMPPERAAQAYAEELKRYAPRASDQVPVLDMILLGTGPDGHVASLFPGTDILKRRKPAAAVFVPKLDSWRISLTFPVINAARHIMLLVSGRKKADIIRHVFLRRTDVNPLPVQLLRPSGQLEWYLDQAAARHVMRPRIE